MRQLPKGFTIREGVKLSGPLPQFVGRMIEHLEKLPRQELLLTAQLAESMNVSRGSIQGWASHSALLPYRFCIEGKKILWGSKKTIAALKKQLEQK